MTKRRHPRKKFFPDLKRRALGVEAKDQEEHAEDNVTVAFRAQVRTQIDQNAYICIEHGM
jgi:hypothetical protein